MRATNFNFLLWARAICVVFASAILALVATASPAVAVTDAEEICPGAPDPCVITETFSIDDQAVLDFGLRTVQITGNGVLDFGPRTATVRCGSFEVATNNTATPLLLRGTNEDGDLSGGSLIVEARRTCSGSASRPCLRLNNCALGACLNNNTCARDPSVACSVAADCDFGTCSNGTGTIDVSGKLNGRGILAGSVIFRAAGDVAVRKPFDLSGSTRDSDGGELEITTQGGSILIEDKLNVGSGGEGFGGSVELTAGGDIDINAVIDGTGGEFDGGFVSALAEGNVRVIADLRFDSAAGEGAGGEIELNAGKDLFLGRDSGTTAFTADGHAGGEGYGGDGGSLSAMAGGNIFVEPSARISATGSIPAAIGGALEFDAERDFVLRGQLDARGRGGDGIGGVATISADRDIIFESTAKLDVSGGRSGGGQPSLTAGEDISFAAGSSITAQAGGEGFGGSVNITAGGNITAAGDIVTNGTGVYYSLGRVLFNACRVRIVDGADIDNRNEGRNIITVGESVIVEAGARLRSDGDGRNEFVYRDPAKPPTLLGTIEPSPDTILDPDLMGCPVCGNNELDQGELCEDGNTTGGDGCSPDCILEGCIDDTPGFPAVPLCDDGSACTTDSCNPFTGRCESLFNCADDVACTTDTCIDNECRHLPNDVACDDQDPCTDTACTASVGCASAFNTDICDDGDSCTVDDRCDQGSCAGTMAEGCVCGDGTIGPVETCDEGPANSDFAGAFCRSDCTARACMVPSSGGATPLASDALFILRASVLIEDCDLRICDVDGSGAVRAGDALTALQASVGIQVVPNCPA